MYDIFSLYQIYELSLDSKDRVGVRIIITMRQHILEQCYSILAKYKLFAKDRFFDTSSSGEYNLAETRQNKQNECTSSEDLEIPLYIYVYIRP